ncbi:cation diffusion facilitator family transporter [Paenibacillaceae bacterium]|nr:cation diffusion facilitator family transporter [Paenibacillaceae bacterium]
MDRKQHEIQKTSALAFGWIWHAALAAAKGVSGGITGSTALLADAVRSASNAVAGVSPGLLSKRVEQAHGKGKQASFSSGTTFTLIGAIALLLLGLEVGIMAVRALIQGNLTAPHPAAAAVIAAAFLMTAFIRTANSGKRDRMASLLAVCGVCGAYAGHVLEMPMLYYLDPVAACAAAAIAMFNGYRLLAGAVERENKPTVQAKEADDLMELIQRIDGVVTVENLEAWEQGHYVAARLRISVNPRITVMEGHEIAKRVKELLIKRFVHLSVVEVSVDPYDPGYPYRSNHDPNQSHMPTLLQ